MRMPLNVARAWGSFDSDGDSCRALKCTRDIRNEIMQPDGWTVKKVIINEADDSAADGFRPEGTTRETLAQMKQVPNHANES